MNRVLFETSYIGSLYGFFNILLGFIAFFSLYFGCKKIARTDKRDWDRKAARITMKVVMVIIVIYIVFLVKGYMDIVISYKTGHYIEIEGIVEGYYFTPDRRGEKEYIFINGVGFHCPASPWGYYPTNEGNKVVMGRGQHLRIRYVRSGNEKVIVYIEQMIPEEDTR